MGCASRDPRRRACRHRIAQSRSPAAARWPRSQPRVPAHRPRPAPGGGGDRLLRRRSRPPHPASRGRRSGWDPGPPDGGRSRPPVPPLARVAAIAQKHASRDRTLSPAGRVAFRGHRGAASPRKATTPCSRICADPSAGDAVLAGLVDVLIDTVPFEARRLLWALAQGPDPQPAASITPDLGCGRCAGRPRRRAGRPARGGPGSRAVPRACSPSDISSPRGPARG